MKSLKLSTAAFILGFTMQSMPNTITFTVDKQSVLVNLTTQDETITLLEYNSYLNLNYKNQFYDDIYFQDGQRVLKSEIDQTKVFCQIDTYNDGTDKNAILKEEKKLVESIEQAYSRKSHTHEVQLELSGNESDFVNDTRCSISANQIRHFLVKDLLKATGNTASLELTTPAVYR